MTMPALPLPFIVTFLLFILLLRFAKVQGMQRQYWPFYSFIVLCAGMSMVVGLRWSTDSPSLRYLQPFLAALLPSATWYCFSALRHSDTRGWWLHTLPFLAVFMASLFWRDALDFVIFGIYLAYGLALILLALKNPDQWVFSRFDDISLLAKAALGVGVAFVISGMVDLGVGLDFAWYQGQHAAQVIAALHTLLILVLGSLIAWVGQTKAVNLPPEVELVSKLELLEPPLIQSAEERDQQAAEYQALVQQLDSVLRAQTLYGDPDLSLNRLARKVGIPARSVSAAVNSVLACNVSQLINAYRVECVTQQLDQSDATITEIMGHCGFQTKSNFNREFRRLTGMNPSEWRKRALKEPFVLVTALSAAKTD